MKRQAETQLGKDDVEEEESDNPGQGFNKADDAVLATRVIRGLPKRGGGARVPENAPTATPAPSVFSTTATPGLSALSTSTNTTNTTSSPFSGFSFKPTASDGSDKTPAASNSFFSVKPSTSPFAPTTSQSSPAFTPSLNPFSSSPPTTTNTSKAFASILSGSGVTNPFAPTSQPSSTSTNEKTSYESAPQKYYMDIRGLNTSVLSAISKTVESDPFVDISDLLEQYKTLRLKIQKDFDTSFSKSDSKSMSSDGTQASDAASKPAMPAPPASFAGFNAGKGITSASSSTGTAKTNLFDFKSTSSTPASNPFASTKEASTPSSVFGGSSFAPSNAPSTAAPTAPSFFTFGTSSDKTTTTPSPFGTFGSSAPSAFNMGGSSTSTNTKSVFGSSTATTSSSPFGGFGSSPADKPASSSIFGGSDKTSSTTNSVFGSAPATTTDAPKNASLFGPGSLSFALGAGKPSTQTTDTEKQDAEDAASHANSENASSSTAEEGTDQATAGLIASTNPHDEDGEGEENEETTHSSRSKAFKLTTDAEGAMKWVGIGSGLLKLKKDKTSGARRVLLRNSTNGKVIMNFSLYAGLKPTQSKSSVSFIGHDAGASQTYTVRMLSEANAQELKGALEKEISFVKAKEP